MDEKELFKYFSRANIWGGGGGVYVINHILWRIFTKIFYEKTV